MKSPLNLASRPARNERLPALLFALATTVLLVGTALHGWTVARLASQAATSLDEEASRLSAELRALGSRERELRAQRLDKATLQRWTSLRALVDLRTFSWTTLLARLEAVLPPDVRLKAITPELKDGRLRLKVDAVARSGEDVVPLVKTLEDAPEFEDVLLASIGEGASDVECQYEMAYRPGPPPAAPPATSEVSSADSAKKAEELGP